MRSLVKSTIAVAIVFMIQPASAMEKGDTFYVSNGIERTVTKIIKDDGNKLELIAQILKDNAIAYCETSLDIERYTKEMNKCVARTIGKPERYKIVCKDPSITTGGISYRPTDPDDPMLPWIAEGKQSYIIKGHDLFFKVCV
jgi:hypothetical protein